MRALLGFHDTRLEAAARALFPVVKRDWRAEPDAARAGVDGVAAAPERLEALVDPAPFHLGARPTLCDLAYPVTLQMALMLAREVERPLALSAKLAVWRDPSTAARRAVARHRRRGDGGVAGGVPRPMTGRR